MKTPHDDFEHALQQLRLRELPTHWKQEILTQAQKPRFAPSRPLLAAFAAAWAVIITLQLLTPEVQEMPQTQNTPAFAPNSLFALHQHPDLLTP
jgi:hypothetical protein